MTKDEILAALPKLNYADLTAVHAMAEHLLGGIKPTEGGLTVGVTQLGHDVFNALATVTASPGAIFNHALEAKVAKKVDYLGPYLDKHFAGWSDSRVTSQAFLQMLIDLLRNDLKKRGVPVTMGTMTVNLGRIPEVIDNAFPDYLTSGHGRVILAPYQKTLPRRSS